MLRPDTFFMDIVKTYKELLQHPKWQIKRLEIIKRDNDECRECHSGEKMLHVHHIKYLKGHKPWEYEDEYLITLCHECHQKEEELKDSNPDLKSVSEMALITCRQCLAFICFIGFSKKYDNKFFLEMKEGLKERRKNMDDKFMEYHG